MKVRRAAVPDAEAIARVHVRSWQVAYRGQLPDDHLNSLDPAERIPRWEAILDETSWPGQGTLIVEDDTATVVGFANLSPTRNADQVPDATGEVTSFYIDPSSWGQGAGRCLMVAALAALATRYRSGTLWVLDTNSRARSFYESTGWRHDGAVKDDHMAGVQIQDLRYVHELQSAPGEARRESDIRR